MLLYLPNIVYLTNIDTAMTESKVWEEILSFNQESIDSDYIPDLRAAFKAYEASQDRTTGKIHAVALDMIQDLRQLAFNSCSTALTRSERHSKLVNTAYEIQKRGREDEEVQTWRTGTSTSERLWVQVCMLARLGVAFQKFKEIALKLPSFKTVLLQPLPRMTSSMNPPKDSLNLKQVFSLLNLPLELETVRSMVGQKWNLSKVQQQFTRRQKQKLNIHAEVQMLLLLSAEEQFYNDIITYFGCSKLSCFMCATSGPRKIFHKRLSWAPFQTLDCT